MWILVVEDDKAMASLLHQGLEEDLHTVTVARDGLEGLAAAETSNYDAIVVDVMMPGMTASK
jgi:CheY-like chemotaxis protein